VTVGERWAVEVKFDLEPLLYELALESLAQTQKAQDRLKRIKYSAATVVFAQATVEAYFNWILQSRMLTHNDSKIRLLGKKINKSRQPISKKWASVIAGVAYLATKKKIKLTKTTEKKAKRLTDLRNYIVHYEGKLISTENLRHTEEGVVVAEAEEKLTANSAKEAVEIAKELILELHERDGSSPPVWVARTKETGCCALNY
jgi:hypothetical protein